MDSMSRKIYAMKLEDIARIGEEIQRLREKRLQITYEIDCDILRLKRKQSELNRELNKEVMR